MQAKTKMKEQIYKNIKLTLFTISFTQCPVHQRSQNIKHKQIPQGQIIANGEEWVVLESGGKGVRDWDHRNG